MLDVLGIDRAVLVQARDYGGVDPVTLDAIARSGGRFRGITMLSPEALDDNLDILVEGGFLRHPPFVVFKNHIRPGDAGNLPAAAA